MKERWLHPPTPPPLFVLPKQENSQRSTLESIYSSVIDAVSSIDLRPSGAFKGGEKLVKIDLRGSWATCGWSLLLKLTAPWSKDVIFILSKVLPIKAKMLKLCPASGGNVAYELQLLQSTEED